MPSFKPKVNNKKLVSSNNTPTIDSKHKEYLNKFENEKNVIIPKLKKEKRKINSKLKKKICIDQKLDLEDKLYDINKKIKTLRNNKNKYYLNNSKYIFDYFENKKNISEGKNKRKVLNEFFNINVDVSNEIIKNISFNKYLANLEDKYIDINNYIYKNDVCDKCNKGEMIIINCEGIIICNKCSNTIRYIVENEKQSYNDTPKEVTFYAYKRINHFKEILAQFQAKETTQIPDEVFINIKNQIKKERMDIRNISNKNAKEILKKLGYNKYYEHISFIKDKLGVKPPLMSPELEEQLCSLFMDIQIPYSKHCPNYRVNFLNYYYTIYKFCELLDQTSFLPYFPMLKDREKRIEQDEIWKKICGELDWEFIPTI